MPRPVNISDRLATRQFVLTMIGGVVVAILLSLAFAVLTGMGGHYPTSSNWLRNALQDWVTVAVSLIGIAVLPALLACWVRWVPMRWLLGRLCQHPVRYNRLAGVGGTFCLFMSTVLLGALLMHLYERRVEFMVDLKLCTGFSLPWLLSSLWATWRVLGPQPESA